MLTPSHNSFIWPSLGLYFSWSIYSLWNTFLITDFRILEPQNVRALHLALFMKITLALLQFGNNFISISSFLGPAWYLVVPGMLSFRPSGNETVGDGLLRLAGSLLPPGLFPGLITFARMSDFGGLDGLVSVLKTDPSRMVGFHLGPALGPT